MPASSDDHRNTAARLLVVEAAVAALVKAHAVSPGNVLSELERIGETLKALAGSQNDKIAAMNIIMAAERLAGDFVGS